MTDAEMIQTLQKNWSFSTLGSPHHDFLLFFVQLSLLKSKLSPTDLSMLSSKLPYLIKDKIKLKVLVHTFSELTSKFLYLIIKWRNKFSSLSCFDRSTLENSAPRFLRNVHVYLKLPEMLVYFTCAWHRLADVLARRGGLLFVRLNLEFLLRLWAFHSQTCLQMIWQEPWH